MLAITPETILSAYAQGAFPMADDLGVIRWYTADPRGILPLDGFQCPRSLRQTIRRGAFDIRVNTDFRAVMEGCRKNRQEGTWISGDLIDLYVRLHEMGFAHSVETWQDGALAGGLYGVAMGGVFFGESMFHYITDASKVALAALVDRLNERKFVLLDTQAVTQHLRRFGCIEIAASDYLRRLHDALTLERAFD
ncbi:MAG: leucyl/phenylalanyl-tRNA--protein transferase [Tepidisphaeraceae bacterium]